MIVKISLSPRPNLYVSSTASREFIILKDCWSLHVFVCLCEFELFTVMFCFVCLPSTVESHLQQQPPPSAVTMMTSPMQAMTLCSSATVPSQTQTSYDPHLGLMQTNSDQLLVQTLTSSSPLFTQVQASSSPLVVQAQASSSPLLNQAQRGLGMHPAEDQVGFIIPVHSFLPILVYSLHSIILVLVCCPHKCQLLTVSKQHQCWAVPLGSRHRCQLVLVPFPQCSSPIMVSNQWKQQWTTFTQHQGNNRLERYPCHHLERQVRSLCRRIYTFT